MSQGDGEEGKGDEKEEVETGKKEKLLVLCIDRDNDLGRKTKLISPVIGRENNLEAAQKLALADPEESDANSIFGAVNTYDEFHRKTPDVEVATICGSPNVGVESDMVIARQLDEVLGRTDATRVLLVSDGADDEFISPIIGSRVKIEGVRRIVVRQSQNLESTYYTMRKALGDPRFQRTFLAPLALILLIVGVSLVSGVAHYGFATILIVLAFYLLVKVMGWEHRIQQIARALYDGFVTGRISLIMYILTALVLMVGAVWSYTYIGEMGGGMDNVVYALSFILNMIWFAVGAVILVLVGKTLDAYLDGERPNRQYLIIFFSAIAIGLVLQGVIKILISLLPGGSMTIPPDSILLLILGVFVGIIGAALHAVLKEGQQTAELV